MYKNSDYLNFEINSSKLYSIDIYLPVFITGAFASRVHDLNYHFRNYTCTWINLSIPMGVYGGIYKHKGHWTTVGHFSMVVHVYVN